MDDNVRPASQFFLDASGFRRVRLVPQSRRTFAPETKPAKDIQRGLHGVYRRIRRGETAVVKPRASIVFSADSSSPGQRRINEASRTAMQIHDRVKTLSKEPQG